MKRSRKLLEMLIVSKVTQVKWLDFINLWRKERKSIKKF